MTPLPAILGGTGLVAWRLDQEVHSATWDSGIGSAAGGGRWNSIGHRAVYCSLDPATTIVESAVHKGFPTLDRVPHTLTSMEVLDATAVHVVQPAAVPNPNWLHPGIVSPEQQVFGDNLLATHTFVVIPSVVSQHSWNLIFDPAIAAGAYRMLSQERFALDTRLHPASPRR